MGMEVDEGDGVMTVRLSPGPSAGVSASVVASLRQRTRAVGRGASGCLVVHQVGVTDPEGVEPDDGPWATNAEVATLLEELFNLPVPILSVTEGHAAGYGTVLALLGDVRFGGPDTAFSLVAPDDAPPPVGAAWLLADRVHGGVAASSLLWHDRLDASRARDVGLLTVVSEGDIGAEVAAAAARVVADRSGRRELVGRMLRRVRAIPFEEALEYDRYACRPAEEHRSRTGG